MSGHEAPILRTYIGMALVVNGAWVDDITIMYLVIRWGYAWLILPFLLTFTEMPL